MTKRESVESTVDSYLDRVRKELRGLPQRQIDDIVRELHAHAIELSEGKGIEAAFASLGDPVVMARAYRAESRIAQAQCSSSNLVILLGLRQAGRTRAGRFLATMLYLLGYINVVGLWVAATDKILFPSRTGLWYVTGDWTSLSLRTSNPPPSGAHELLGWWLVPAAILAGWLLRLATDHIARWWIRRHRNADGGSRLLTFAN